MIGYPKNLNSKEDYEYVHANFPKEYWKKDFEDLLTSSKDWFFTGYLSSKEEGIEDSTHKVIDNTENNGEDTIISEDKKFSQYEYKLNPNCKMSRLGFTEEEIISILN